jgi:hypothetical protein
MSDDHNAISRWRSPVGMFVLIAGGVGLYYLLTEHLTHVTQAIPYLLLLACPVMHLFGHGHGPHGHSDHRPDKGEQK